MSAFVLLLLFAESIEGNSLTQPCFDDYGTPAVSTPIFSVTNVALSPWPPNCKGSTISCNITGVFSKATTANNLEVTLIDDGLTIWYDTIRIQSILRKANQLYTFRFTITIPNFGYFFFGNYEFNLKLLDCNSNELNC